MSNLEESFDYLSQKAISSYQNKEPGVAEKLFKLCYFLAPEHPTINACLGLIYIEAGFAHEAVAHLERASEGDPDKKTLANLGAAYMRTGDMDRARETLEKVVEEDPDYDMALSNLGHVYRAENEDEKSLEVYFRAHEKLPDNPVYIMNIANAYASLGNLEKAQGWLNYGLNKKEFPEYWNNLGNIHNKLGRFKEAKDCYQRMLDLKPNASAAANMVLVNLYDPDTTPQSQRMVAESAMSVLQGEAQTPHYDHDKPRVGFLSAHFGKHPVGFFTTGLFRANKELDYYVYNNRYSDDPITEEIQEHTHYRAIHGWREDHVIDQIKKDEIDILVDLGGLSGKNSIKIFKQKPAPVQIGWVGYAGTRGMEEIDYLLTDWTHSPEGTEDHYTETPLRLPNDYVTYYPAHKFNIRRKDVPMTFIAAHNSCKMNPKILEMWSEILKRVPESRLIMAYKGLKANEERIKQSMDVDEDRIIIHDHIKHEEMLKMYNEADVCLDTYPYSGGLVVCESLWMGVPVVTLPSSLYSGRHAASHLKNVGLEEYIAKDERDYIEIAVKMAKPLPEFTRKSIRAMVEDSPLMDYEQFSHDFNSRMWEVWK